MILLLDQSWTEILNANFISTYVAFRMWRISALPLSYTLPLTI